MLRSSRFLPLAALVLADCTQTADQHDDDTIIDATVDAITDAPDAAPDTPELDSATPLDASDASDAPTAPTWCSLGADVPGAVVPAGYCLRLFAHVAEPRTLAFAPDGDLFVGAPSTFAAGGAGGGPGAVLVLSDDDRDGTAETHTYLANVADVHGIAIGGGSLFFTTQFDVMRVPYADGQRAANARPESMSAPSEFGNGGRWTHGLAFSTSGALYASRGEYATCGANTPGGTIYAGTANVGTLAPASTGFRNPMYLRCHPRDELCMASELGEDLAQTAREKLLVIQSGADFGYPCCYANGVPSGPGAIDCATVAREEVSFPIDTTPFGLDWERGVWSAPYANALFVALHGSFYSTPQYQGAAVVFFATDPTTHRPVGTPQQFLGGWGNRPTTNDVNPYTALSRPADIAFAPDGRMFVADDLGNGVYWVAPTTLPLPTR